MVEEPAEVAPPEGEQGQTEPAVWSPSEEVWGAEARVPGSSQGMVLALLSSCKCTEVEKPVLIMLSESPSPAVLQWHAAPVQANSPEERIMWT